MANRSPLCGKAKEELNHILIHCPSVWGLWEGLISTPSIDWLCPLLAKDLILGWSCFPIRKRLRKLWKAAPLYLFSVVWMERNRIVFDDVHFSLSRLKTSFLSKLVSWTSELSWRSALLYEIFCASYRFLLGGRFFCPFLYRSGSSLYTMGFPSSLLFFVNIFAQLTYQKKKGTLAPRKFHT